MSKRITTLQVKELGDYLKDADSCVLINYVGITAEQATKMRKTLREKDIRLRLVRNTLSRIALKDLGREGIAGLIDGPTAVASGGEDPIVLAKAVAECTKTNEHLTIKGGYCDGQVLTSAQVQAFAKIPSRKTLYAQIAGSINAPLANVAGMFASVQRSLVTALKAIADQKAGQNA